MKAQKLPSGNYRIKVYLGKDQSGKKIFQSVTHSDKSVCGRVAAEVKINGRKDISDITYGEAVDNYIALKSNILSPATITGYRKMRKSRFPMLIPMKISKITRDDIQKAVNIEAASKGSKTVRNGYGLLTAVFGLYRPDLNLGNITLPQKNKPKIYVPSDDEIKTVLKLAEGTSLELPIMLAAFGSLRRSEVCALTHEDIEGNIITVDKAIVQNDKGEWVIKTTKTVESTRRIEMPSTVIQKIPDGTGPLFDFNPSALSLRFRKFLRKNNIKPFTFHSLRHYQATVLHTMGVPDKYIMQRGGWKTDHTLKNIYQHTFDSVTASTNEKVNNYFDKIVLND